MLLVLYYFNFLLPFFCCIFLMLKKLSKLKYTFQCHNYKCTIQVSKVVGGEGVRVEMKAVVFFLNIMY